jgi:predicted choloylglycine hydrolase
LEALCDYLFENHQIELTPDSLAHIKARHYPKIKHLIEQANKNTMHSKPFESSENQIEQNVEESIAKTLYEKMYQKEKSNTEFDLGHDF